jgi:hypothetical protein
MHEVDLVGVKAQRLLDIVHELKASEYVLHQDFDYCYIPPCSETSFMPTARFIFYTEGVATWFAIKYN